MHLIYVTMCRLLPVQHHFDLGVYSAPYASCKYRHIFHVMCTGSLVLCVEWGHTHYPACSRTGTRPISCGCMYLPTLFTVPTSYIFTRFTIPSSYIFIHMVCTLMTSRTMHAAIKRLKKRGPEKRPIMYRYTYSIPDDSLHPPHSILFRALASRFS